MEYVILLVFVGTVLMIASTQLFFGYSSTTSVDPDSGEESTSATLKFGAFGREIQGFYQRTLGGLSLPVP